MSWAILVTVPARVRDILIAGLGDSFASGRRQPRWPVAIQRTRASVTLYPLRRAERCRGGSAQWTDEACAIVHSMVSSCAPALQIAIENCPCLRHLPRLFLLGGQCRRRDLGQQTYVERLARTDGSAQLDAGGKAAFRWCQGLPTLQAAARSLLATISTGITAIAICPGNNFRRTIDSRVPVDRRQ